MSIVKRKIKQEGAEVNGSTKKPKMDSHKKLIIKKEIKQEKTSPPIELKKGFSKEKKVPKKEKQNGEVVEKKKIKKEKSDKENLNAGKAPMNKKAKLEAKIKTKKEHLKSGEPAVAMTKIEMREKQKKVKEERKKKKDGTVFELGVQAKKVWEEVRREDCPKDRQVALLNELHELVKGKVKSIVRAHDTSRVIECLVSLGDEKIRDALYNEVKDDLTDLMKSRYAVFFVQKLVKHSNKKQQEKIFKDLEGRVAKLARHKYANAVLELCYNELSNGVQRSHILQEFFGPEFQHFKDDSVKNVLDVLTKYPEKTKSVVINLMENSNILVTKGCYNISLVHSVLYNYMLALNNNSGPQSEKNKAEFVASLRDVCVHLIHSHDGARLTMQALWSGTAKDRKSMIKSFKGHVAKIAAEEQGHLALLALFDCVDDTKLVGKAIVGELTSNLTEVLSTKHGRDVVVYLMSPRNSVWFYPGTLDILKQGDANPHSKKDSEIRRKELFEIAAPAVLKHLLENLNELIREGGTSVIMVQEVLKTASKCVANAEINGLFKSIFTLLAEEAAKPFVSGDDESNIVENAATHRMLNKLMTQDKENKAVADCVLFSPIFADAIDSETIDSYLGCNRGCFILVNLLETDIADVQKKLSELLKTQENKLKKKKSKGAEILAKKLEEFQKF